MELTEIKTKKQSGDLVTVSRIVGIAQGTVNMALKVPGSKHHGAVVKALEAVINSREQLISSLSA